MKDGGPTLKTWPAVAYEDRPWTSPDNDMLSRSRRRRHLGPYQAAVVKPIADLTLDLPGGVVSQVEEATRELVRFDTQAGQLIAPFSSILLRAESASSSQIENLTTSARQLGLAELGLGTSRNANLVVANVRATQAALELAAQIDEAAIIAVHRALLESSQPTAVGGWREEQVWVGGTGAGPHAADFVPPHHDHINENMRDLVAFMARRDLPALPQIAVAHAQFETIHPFPDGNGRTGRALVQAMLKHKGLAQQLTLPLSAGLLSNTPYYFVALTRYRDGDPSVIIQAFNEAAVAAVRNGRELEADLLDVQAWWSASLEGTRRDASVRRALPVVMASPVFDVALLSEQLEVSLRAAYNTIEALLERGLISRLKQARRNQVWFSHEVLTALDAFAARARRG